MVFVDAPILVCAQDAEAGIKRERAVETLRMLWSSGTGRLSVQVLQEFYVSVTCKLTTPLARSTAREVVRAYGAWVCTNTTDVTVLRAAEIADMAQLSFWDALIVASAEETGAALIYSERMRPGQRIAGIEIVNPLSIG